MDLQIFSRGQDEETCQKGDKIIPATMGLVPSDLTSLGQHTSGLVKVWPHWGFWMRGLGEVAGKPKGYEVWVRQPVSYTTSCVKSFLLKQRTRIAKQHQAPRKKHFSRMFVSLCFPKQGTAWGYTALPQAQWVASHTPNILHLLLVHFLA